MALSRRFARDFEALPRHIQEAIDRRLDQLEQDPFQTDIRKLVGMTTTYRVRAGDYRIIVDLDLPPRPPRCSAYFTVARRIGKLSCSPGARSVLSPYRCLAAAAAIPGTIPNLMRGASSAGSSAIRIWHPKGVVVRTADVESAASPPRVRSVGAVRTARRLMEGTAYVRNPFSAR